MPSRAATLWLAAACAVAGTVLLVLASIHVLRGHVLSTTGNALLFTGFGLVVVAGVLAIVGTWATGPTPGSDPVIDVVPAEATGSGVDVGAGFVADTAPDWRFLCRAECAGRVEAGDLSSSVRRGATVSAYREGLRLTIGKTDEQRTWEELTAITAVLDRSETTITVSYDGRHGDTAATFTGRNADLAPVATALAAAAPSDLVAVTYA
jgi:hypothetical protein